MDLLSRFLVIAGELREGVFHQQRSARRAVSLMLAGLLSLAFMGFGGIGVSR